MRKSLFYVLFFLACVLCQSAEAKVKQKPVYLFGFATSFVDSIAYITDVQYIESSYIETKSKFLVGRNVYSLQLQQFLDKNEGCKHPVTSIFYGKKKEKMEKRRLSIFRRYERDFTLKTVECPFQAESYEEQGIADIPVLDAADKKASKKSKKK